MGKASRKKRERRGGTALNLPSWLRDNVCLHSDHDGPKISAQLIDLIKPYRIHAETSDRLKTLVAMGAIAWNLSRFEKSKRGQKMAQLAKNVAMSEDSAMDFSAILDELIARKLNLFPEDQRFIVSYEVTDRPHSFHISAAAIIQNPDTQKQNTALAA